MKKILLLAVMLFGFNFCLSPVVGVASADDGLDPLQTACFEARKKGIDSPNCPGQPSENPLTGPNGIILRIASFLAIIAGVIAVIIVIISGFRYITAGGDAKKAAEARGALIGAIIGIVIIALASLIVTFVVRRIYS